MSGVEHIADIALRCPNLKEFASDETVKINDEILIGVSICCPQLKSLIIENGVHLTDRGLLRVAKNLRNLNYIYIQNAPLVSDKSVMLLAKNTSGLIEAEFLNTSITGQSLKLLLDRHASTLKIVAVGTPEKADEEIMKDIASQFMGLDITVTHRDASKYRYLDDDEVIYERGFHRYGF
jgi:hypothetical protein